MGLKEEGLTGRGPFGGLGSSGRILGVDVLIILRSLESGGLPRVAEMKLNGSARHDFFPFL